ncbi:MAG: transglutaminase family protein [Betaproteobacteria bacterium]|nr:transglutaminase family protein [Betaproteobacteria bacterium]
MTIRVALHHKTHYHFDRPVSLSPHEIRLRPAAHCRTPIDSYSLTVRPKQHFINWQQDPYGNWLARLTFPEKTRELSIEIDLVADMTVINPFDFFIEKSAEKFPFAYANRHELTPYLAAEPAGPKLAAWLDNARQSLITPDIATIDLLVALNQRLQHDIRYTIRLEPGVQDPDQTLALALGSCRDSAWLLVQILRHLGIAARFTSGYLIQLVADQKPLDGPAGTDQDFTDLHAWAEAYLPGAGWVGLDPTSGLLTGEGHIPLASTAVPASAAPVSGLTDVCESTLDFAMQVTRIHEDARVTKPYSEAQWRAIDQLGQQVDQELARHDVRLTMGGEPTFVSIDDMEGPEWNFTAHSPEKKRLATALLQRLKGKFSPGALLHFGQGKWYPGEPLPRWALSCYWRPDGQPVWQDDSLFAWESREENLSTDAAALLSGNLARAIAQQLGLHPDYAQPAYESVWKSIRDEAALPLNVDPLNPALTDPAARHKLAAQLAGALGQPTGYVLPLKVVDEGVVAPSGQDALSKEKNGGSSPESRANRASSQNGGIFSRPPTRWASSLWPLRTRHIFLLEGDSPIGYRLPLASLPEVAPADVEILIPQDPFAPRAALSAPPTPSTPADNTPGAGLGAAPAAASRADAPKDVPKAGGEKVADEMAPAAVVRTALCVEVREGIPCVFLPPLMVLEDFLALVRAIEAAAAALKLPVRIEGYAPPTDPRLKKFAITPDPGVIEVNIHPAAHWPDLCAHTFTLYEEARQTRLGTEKFMLDGRHSGTGGGNHVTLGGPTPADSPLLRRPDLLESLITYWQNHPALSYLFSGMFIGPTSQSPRVDEARSDTLYELEIAFEQLRAVLGDKSKKGDENDRPWLVDRILRNFLVDLTGNTHRAEFSIDKLYAPDSATGRLGLLEFRAFEMPPHAQMSLTQMLLLRALVARFWQQPYGRLSGARLIRWGTELHDRFMLPYFVALDMKNVVDDLNAAGYAFRFEWFAPFLEFRFPRYGTVAYQGIQLELRQAIEPWHVLGEELSGSGTSRYVDSSVERMQIKVVGMTHQRHLITCNGRVVPMTPTGVPGEFVAGVRYRAWAPPSALHPTIGVQTPLVFDIVDTWAGRSIGGCTYHVAHPGGRNYGTFPVNAFEAEARRVARFQRMGHTPGTMPTRAEGRNPAFPYTLDLRKEPDYDGAHLMPQRPMGEQ